MNRLRALQRTVPQSALRFPGFHAPLTVDELASALQAAPDSLLLAGGTDIGLWTTKHLRDLPPIVYLGAIAELQEIRNTDAGLRIGAGVSLSAAWSALVAEHPALAEQARRFASPPVCNSGTLLRKYRQRLADRRFNARSHCVGRRCGAASRYPLSADAAGTPVPGLPEEGPATR